MVAIYDVMLNLNNSTKYGILVHWQDRNKKDTICDSIIHDLRILKQTARGSEVIYRKMNIICYI